MRWAHATFGITRATVALTPSSASFVAESLADLPLELRLLDAPPGRPLHAKFYWFDGAEGPAAVMGSANCSAAAWLLAPAGGGNTESVVIYDQPDAESFAGALELFAAPGQLPGEFLNPRTLHDSTPTIDQAPFAIKSLQWDNASLRMYAEIYPPLLPWRKFPYRLVGATYRWPRCQDQERCGPVTLQTGWKRPQFSHRSS